jgi:hypothetical protein
VKKILPPQVEDNSSEDEIVSDDEAFFREHGEFVSFLGGIDASTLAEDTCVRIIVPYRLLVRDIDSDD